MPKATTPKPTLRRRVTTLLIALFALYALLLVIVIVAQNWLIFPGAAAHFGTPAVAPDPNATPAVTFTRHASDGGGKALYFQAGDPTDTTPRPAVVFWHGNGETARLRTDVAQRYNALGIHALLVEYPGYDDAPGSPSERSIVAASRDFIGELTQRPEVDPDRLIYHGFSLGGGVAGQLGKLRPPAALVLVSTFTSIPDVGPRWLVPSFVYRSTTDTREVLRTFERPLLIVHGDADSIIPIGHGRKLAAAARDAEFVTVSGAGHNDIATHSPYARAIADFLARHGFTTP
jgi:fermentation-respiration switch protein FrsA (DUF1100 family)